MSVPFEDSGVTELPPLQHYSAPIAPLGLIKLPSRPFIALMSILFSRAPREWSIGVSEVRSLRASLAGVGSLAIFEEVSWQ